MKASELKDFSASDLQGRVKQWREELFRSRFKTETSEARDTSVVRKLRKDIARALTILNMKQVAPESAAAPAEAAPQDKPAKKASKAKKQAE